MDRYEEKARKIMARGDAIIAERKRRRAVLVRSCAIGAGAAAVLGIGVTTYAICPPKKPVPDSASTVYETNDVNAVANNSASNNSVATALLTTASSTAETTTTVSETAAPTETTSASTQTTTQTAAVTTTETTTATQPAVTMPSGMTYADIVAANVQELTLFEDNQYKLWRYYTESDQRTKAIAEEDIGELLTEISVEPTEYTELLPETLNADVYQIGSISGDYAVAVRFEGTDLNFIYHNFDYKPTNLGQFADDIDIYNNLEKILVNNDSHSYQRPANKETAFGMIFSERDASIYPERTSTHTAVYLTAMITDIPDDFFRFKVDLSGYLEITTSIEKKYTYKIGKENAKAFIAYVDDQY